MSFNIIYPLAKFCLAKIIIPVIQVIAWVNTPSRKNKKEISTLLVSSRTDSLSSSFRCLVSEIEKRDYRVEYHSVNYAKLRLVQKLRNIYLFFCLYKNADFVFLDDTFLPVSFSIKSNRLSQAYIVQMWHSCGIFKKTGLDICQSYFSRYIGRANYKNYDLVSVSSEKCRAIIAGFMGIDMTIVKALGLSRTDTYFDLDKLGKTTTRFYQSYPYAIKRKIIAYAPTYRGQAFNVEGSPIPEVISLFASLDGGFAPFVAPHPHENIKENAYDLDYDISSVLHLIDILVTDYSSLAMDYMIANPRGKLILYVPDLAKYSCDVGFYIRLEEITCNIAHNNEQLLSLLKESDKDISYVNYKDLYLNSCNGSSTKNLLDYLNI
ncbi:CDP-glycerol glycerophosphotransferase family protein [Vibrio breoganii]|uniref:CDP-glycerol glycerophosphotransferase family protein n=1 Tax=Vibrio breoganii TaxID=553239 RepID=UPI0012FFEDB0|nr:CDP-glycerol glycerophosphotransferase family protein [Vibrio breoganii]